MRPALLLAAALLAGCAVGPTSGPPVHPTGPALGSDAPRQDLEDRWPANGTFSLGTTSAPHHETQAHLPPNVAKVTLTVRFESGAIAGFRASLGPCVLDVPGPAPATGQTLPKDCGRLHGDHALRLEQPTGTLAGTYTVHARVCPGPATPGARCMAEG